MFQSIRRYVPMMGILFTSAFKYFYVVTKAHIVDLLTTYRSAEPESELHAAARKGKAALLRCLLENEEWGKFANCTNNKNETPLHLVAASGNVDCAQLLLDYGADSTICDISGMTSLHKTATGGHKQVLDLIIRAQGCGSLNVRDAWGWTPLQRALLNFHYQTASILLEHGCSVNDCDEKGRTALHVVASYGHVRMVSMLISKGANVNCQDSKGWTPLMLSVLGGHVQVVRDLIHNGCDINLKNRDGAHALTLCSRSLTVAKYSCALELIQAGATSFQIVAALEDLWLRLSREGSINNNNNNDSGALTHPSQELRNNIIRLLIVSTSYIPLSIASKAQWWLDQQLDAARYHVLRLITVAGTLSMLGGSAETEKNNGSFSCPKLKDIARCASRLCLAEVHGNVLRALNKAKDLPYGLKELLVLNDV